MWRTTGTRSTIATRLGRRLFGIEVAGIEHLPDRGPVIVAANHSHRRLDPLVLGLASPRRPTFVSAVDLRSTLLQRLATLVVDILYVGEDPAALARFRHECTRAFDRGEMLVIFPEGTTMGGGTGVFHHGVAYLALQGPVPIAPAWIERCGRRTFRVRFGALLQPPHAPLNRRSLTRLTDEIRAAILALADAAGTAANA